MLPYQSGPVTAIDLICCPYDSGRRNWRCGQAPALILRQGLVERLQGGGAEVRIVEIEATVDYPSEAAIVFETHRQIAKAFAAARVAGRLPLVLAGNCNAAVGGVSGMAGGRRGLIWFDAHGDFCTPETTDSGFLDGMGLAMLVGRCWQHVLSTVPGYAPVPDSAIALIGARDLDPWEEHDLAASAICCLSTADLRAGQPFDAFLTRLVRDTDGVYVHIDIDVHEPAQVPANHYQAAGGLSAEEVRNAVMQIGRYTRIASAGMSSYDPAFDPEGKTAAVAATLLEAVVAAHRLKRAY